MYMFCLGPRLSAASPSTKTNFPVTVITGSLARRESYHDIWGRTDRQDKVGRNRSVPEGGVGLAGRVGMGMD